jgi:hypothetical protein
MKQKWNGDFTWWKNFPDLNGARTAGANLAHDHPQT